jgi:hypothetical protein
VDPGRAEKGEAQQAQGGPERSSGVTLDYARPDVPPWWVEQLKGLVRLLGGVRQIWFALGLAFVLGGIGAGIDRWGHASLMMWIGGLFLGLAIRVPRWGRGRPAGM